MVRLFSGREYGSMIICLIYFAIDCKSTIGFQALKVADGNKLKRIKCLHLGVQMLTEYLCKTIFFCSQSIMRVVFYTQL
jgi:hypothetical protein